MSKKASKALMIGALLGVMVMTTGCFTLDETHNRNHLRSFESDWSMIHETIDRHFFNYDWDDPDDY